MNIEALKAHAKYQFGKGSQAKLETGHQDLQLILTVSILTSIVDFGLSEVARSFETQLTYFLATPPKTTLDPRDSEKLKHAKHVITEYRPMAEAADIYIYHPDKAIRKQLVYDKASLAYVAGHIQGVAWRLYDAGLVDHVIRWGGNWDSDGVIIQDQSFDDLPHVELIKPNRERIAWGMG